MLSGSCCSAAPLGKWDTTATGAGRLAERAGIEEREDCNGVDLGRVNPASCKRRVLIECSKHCSLAEIEGDQQTDRERREKPSD